MHVCSKCPYNISCLPSLPVSCGGGIFDEPEGHLSSPGYPNSPPHAVSCQYVIAVESGFTVSLSFSDNFQIESVDTEQGLNCLHHWLQVLTKRFHTLYIFISIQGNRWIRPSINKLCIPLLKVDHSRQRAHKAVWFKESRSDSYKLQHCQAGVPH